MMRPSKTFLVSVSVALLLLVGYLVIPGGASTTGYGDLCFHIRVFDQHGQPVSGPFTVTIENVERRAVQATGNDGLAHISHWFAKRIDTWRRSWGPTKTTEIYHLGGKLQVSAPNYQPWERPLSMLFEGNYDARKFGTNLTCTVSLTPGQGM
jgi:hypothetical protein